MTREERLAREAVIIARTGLNNAFELIKVADLKMTAIDPKDFSVTRTGIDVRKALADIDKLINDRGW